MNDREPYPDPALARRFKDWLDQAAPPAAPERLVFAVMDEVETVGRPRLRLGAIRLETILQYVALTVVVAIGVAAGTLLSRSEPGASQSPGPPSSVPASASPEPVPSLATIGRSVLSRAPGVSAIGVTEGRLWVGTAEGTVVEIDSASGAELSRTAVGPEPTAIRSFGDRLWIGSGGPDLVWLDPRTHAIGSVDGAGGQALVVADGSLWVGGRDRLSRIDPAGRTVVGTIDVPGRRPNDLALLAGDELWSAVGPSVVRFALPSGAKLGTIDVHPLGIVQSAQGVLAVDAGRLLQLSSPSRVLVTPATLLGGLPDPVALTVVGDRLWILGSIPGRAGEVDAIDLPSLRVLSRTFPGGGGRALAVVGGSVWVGVDSGALVQLAGPP
jgi:hypothetical protein